MDAHGGTITWRLTAHDAEFIATMLRARQEARRTARDVDRNLNRGVASSNNRLRTFQRELARTAYVIRNLQVATRGLTMTSAILGVAALTGAAIELAGALVAVSSLIFTLPSALAIAGGAAATLAVGLYGIADAFDAIGKEDPEKLAEALEKLSPAARSAVKALKDVYDEFKPIRTIVQEELFRGLDKEISSLAKVTLPTLEKGLKVVAESMNLVAKEAARVAREPFFQRLIADSLNTTSQATNILRQAIEPLARSLAVLVDIGNEYILQLAEWVVRQSELAAAFLESEDGQRKLTAQLDLGVEALGQILGLVGDVAVLLNEMFRQSEEGGASFLRTMRDAVQAVTAFLRSAEGSSSFQAFIRVTNDVLQVFLETLGQLSVAIINIFAALDRIPEPIRTAVIQFLAWVAATAVILPYFSRLIGSLELIRDTLLVFIGPQIIITAGLLALAYAMGSTGETAQILQGWLSQIPVLLQSLVDALPGVIQGLATMIPQIINTIVAGFPLLLDLAVQIIMILAQGILDNLPLLINTLPGIVIAIVNGILTLGVQLVEVGFELILALTQGIVSALPDIIDATVDLVNTIIDYLVDAIPEFIDAGFQLILRLVDGFIAAYPSLVDGAIRAMTLFYTAIIETLPRLIEAGIQIIQGLINALVANLPLLIQAAIAIITTLLNLIVANLPLLLNAAVFLMNSLVNGIVESLPLLIDAAIQLVETLTQALVDNLPLIIEAAITITIALVNAIIENLPLIIDAAIKVILALVDGLVESIHLLFPAVLRIINALVDATIQLLPLILAAGVKIIVELAKGLIKAIPEVIAAIGTIIGDLLIEIANSVSKMVLAGVDLIKGLIKGIGNAKNLVVDKIKEICSSALNAVKRFFGIGSPSKVMAQMGGFLMDGFNNGIEKSGQAVISSVQSVSDGIGDIFGGIDGQNISATVRGDIQGISTMPRSIESQAVADGARIENNIGTINIGSEVDGENWLNKLTRDDQITKAGLVAA